MAKRIEVALDQLDVRVLEDGREVRHITDCSGGRPGHPTPEIHNGSLSMTKRDEVHHSTIYDGALMPFALFFEQNPTCAFHQGPTSVASHGCIHLNPTDAKWLFEWAGHDPVGLEIRGPYPQSPVRTRTAGAEPDGTGQRER